MTGVSTEVANSHEPSYYEIALTNRQVVVAFVILLICLLSAFFSGLWIGRESEARAQEQLVRNAPPPETQEAAVDEEGRELEEFQFFDSGQNGPAGRQAAGDTTLAEDVGAEPTPEERVEEEPPVVEPTPAPPVTEEPSEPRNRRDRRKEREERAALERAAAERTPPAPPRAEPSPEPVRRREPETAPAAGGGKVVIQVFSSPEKDQAEKIRDRLVSGGQQAYLSPVEVSGNTMYRVRIGPFSSRDDAQKAAEKVRKGFKLDTWITE